MISGVVKFGDCLEVILILSEFEPPGPEQFTVNVSEVFGDGVVTPSEPLVALLVLKPAPLPAHVVALLELHLTVTVSPGLTV